MDLCRAWVMPGPRRSFHEGAQVHLDDVAVFSKAPGFIWTTSQFFRRRPDSFGRRRSFHEVIHQRFYSLVYSIFVSLLVFTIFYRMLKIIVIKFILSLITFPDYSAEFL